MSLEERIILNRIFVWGSESSWIEDFMPPKKRANPATAGSGAGGSQIESTKLKAGEQKTEPENEPPKSKKIKVEATPTAVAGGDVDYSKMKVSGLKEQLEAKGLDTSGNRPELVARLEAAAAGGGAAKSAGKGVKKEADMTQKAPKMKSVKEPAPKTEAAKEPAPKTKAAKEPAPKTEAVKEPAPKTKAVKGPAPKTKAVKEPAPKTKAVKEPAAAKTAAKTAPKTAAKEEPKEDEPMEEETDFGQAMRALATASSDTAGKKNGVLKHRKVDSGLPGRVVVGDWDCMLNQTNIGHNNSKYYVIQLIQCGSSYQLWTRWGRVGEPGQNETKWFGGSLEEAQKTFKKLFSDKTKNKWENRDKFVPVPGKYMLIEMDEDGGDDEEMVQKLEALDKPDCSPPVTKVVRPSTLETPTQSLIKLLFNTDMFNHAMKSMEIDTKKMPLGKLSKAQIAKGFEALEAVEKALDESAPKSKLAELTSKFYTIIPHSFGRHIPPVIDNKEMLQKKFDMLMVLGDIELAQGLQKQKDEDKKKAEAAATEVPNPLDVHYESLNAKLTLLDTSSDEYQVIVKYLKATEPQWRSLKLQHVWRVDRFKVEDRFKEFDGISNRRLLWHGTNVAMVAAILKSGLRIMPHSGGRVGKGIYLASENSKSAGYVRCAADGTGIMFLNEAALGKEHHITMADYRLTAPPFGYDCIIAKGRTEPDPKEDSSLTLDGKTVAVPQGKPISTQHSNSNFSQSEYLVYKESQTRIRYMLQLKFN